MRAARRLQWPIASYTLGLDALTGRQAATPQPVGLRVFETVDHTPRAFFDVSEDEQPVYCKCPRQRLS